MDYVLVGWIYENDDGSIDFSTIPAPKDTPWEGAAIPVYKKIGEDDE